MAFAHVGSTAQQENTSTAASLQLNLAQTATNGNMLVVTAFCAGGASAPTITITDSAGNTWTAAVSVSNTVGYLGRFVIAYARNITGSPTWVKVTPSVSAFISLIVDEYSGADNTATPQATNSGVAQGPSTPAVASSITPSNANSLAYFGEGNDGSAAETVTASSGYTRRGNLTNTAAFPAGSSDNVSVSAATNPSIAFGANENWQAGLVVFAPAAASTPTPDQYQPYVFQPDRSPAELIPY